MTNAHDFFPHGDSRHYWYIQIDRHTVFGRHQDSSVLTYGAPHTSQVLSCHGAFAHIGIEKQTAADVSKSQGRVSTSFNLTLEMKS